MEKVLFDEDLFSYILKFLPKIYHINLYKICKTINKLSPEICCNECENSIFLPIIENDKIYCFDCYDKLNIINNERRYLDKHHIKTWKLFEKCKTKKYIKCKYCNITCANYEFAHYHLLHKCLNYSIILNKLGYGEYLW